MIFRESWQLVLKRVKTQTRRPKKPGDEFRVKDEFPYIYNTVSRRIRYMSGRDYTVQPGHGRPSVGKIRILGIRVQKLQDITPQDAIAEGLALETRPGLRPATDFMAGFIEAWNNLYATGQYAWDADPIVYVYEFELVESYREVPE
jgi:hypothetical protein